MESSIQKKFLFLLLLPLFFVMVIGKLLSPAPVDVGVVLDLQSWMGRRALTSINLAMDDFYTLHSNFSTKLVLHLRDSQQDVIGAASAAFDLMKNVQVQAIIGPQSSSQAEFVAYLCTKSQIPMLTFSSTSPSLSSVGTPYFIRTTLNDASQVALIVDLVRHFGWREIVPVYEDTRYCAGVVPFYIDAMQDIGAKVPYRSIISPSPTDNELDTELLKLMNMHTRVFVVHMTGKLGVKFFKKAADVGMTTAGYVWIVSDGITDALDIADTKALATMQGAIGVRPYMPRSKDFANFTSRWKARFRRDNPNLPEPEDPTILQVQAYDTAWAVALAAEKANIAGGPRFRNPSGIVAAAADTFSTSLAKIGVSQTGQKLLNSILETSFKGVSGEFKLIAGQLQSSAFQIVNVVGNQTTDIGFWTPNSKLNLSSTASITWPGNLEETPKGWQIPPAGKKLRVGVPMKNGFNEFVNVSWDPITKKMNVTGFSVDVFETVMKAMPYSVPYEYVPFEDHPGRTPSYDIMVYQVYLQNLDAIVGDTTIVANRSLYVDFTQPYTESGVSMVVPMKAEKSNNMWIFLKPLSTNLWVASVAFFIFTGVVAWAIEHRINKDFRGTPAHQLGTIFYFGFSTLVFAHREKLESNMSRVIMVIWVFVVLILTQSYTASLTSMLTAEKLQPTVADVNELLKNGHYVGYQDGSFVESLLKRMGFPEHRLKNYTSMDQYADALSKGSSNGGVTAFFDEIPYLKLFLSKYCHVYGMVGPMYKTEGFGFAFPKGSPLVADVSRAILNVTEGVKMVEIEKKWFGDQTGWITERNRIETSSSLKFQSFGGLFLISGVVSGAALLIFCLQKFFSKCDNAIDAAARPSMLRSIANYFHSKKWKSPTLKNQNGENSGNVLKNDENSHTTSSISDSSELFSSTSSPIGVGERATTHQPDIATDY